MSNSNVYGVAGKVVRPLGGSISGIKTITGNYTLKPSDHNKLIIATTTDAIEILVPRNNRMGIGVGFSVQVQASSTGSVYFVKDTGVAVYSVNNYLGIISSGGHVELNLLELNEWDLEGDVTPALDADAKAYIDAVGTFSNAEKININFWFASAKLNGYYSKYHAVYLFLGGTATAHKFNAVNPIDTDGAFRMVFTGSPTHNANGVTFNGSTQYGNTKLNPSLVLAQNSKHYSYYLRVPSTGCDYGALDGSFKGDHLHSLSGANQSQNLSKIYTLQAAAGTRTRLWQHNRDSSTNSTLKRDGATLTTDTGASDVNINLEMILGARNSSGVINVFNASGVCFFAIGDSFTAGQETSEKTDVDALQLAFARNV